MAWEIDNAGSVIEVRWGYHGCRRELRMKENQFILLS
jgi:hypothetical protein